MSSNSTFDNSAMDTYMSTVSELTRLTEAGATDSEILVAKMYMSIALADLVAPTETAEYRANLVLIFMRHDNPTIYGDMPPLEDVDVMPSTPPLAEEEAVDPIDMYDDMPALE